MKTIMYITVAPKPGNLCAGPATDDLPGVLCLNSAICTHLFTVTRVRARWRNIEWAPNFSPSLFQAAAVFNLVG